MDRDKIELGIRAIRELEEQRNMFCKDIEFCIAKINTHNKEITEIMEILNAELIIAEIFETCEVVGVSEGDR